MLSAIACGLDLLFELGQLSAQSFELESSEEGDHDPRARPNGRGASRLVVEQRDLTDDGAGPEDRDPVVAVENLDLTLEDHEELVSRLAFLHEQLIRRLADPSREPCDARQLVLGQVREERDLTQLLAQPPARHRID